MYNVYDDGEFVGCFDTYSEAEDVACKCYGYVIIVDENGCIVFECA